MSSHIRSREPRRDKKRSSWVRVSGVRIPFPFDEDGPACSNIAEDRGEGNVPSAVCSSLPILSHDVDVDMAVLDAHFLEASEIAFSMPSRVLLTFFDPAR